MLRFAVPVVTPSGLAPSFRSARVVAIIPARYRSTRLHAKALALIDGRPMVEHVYRRASEARTVDAVLVATDDERIADVVASFGGTAVMTRPDHASGTDRLAEVAAALDSDLVVNVQGDLPFLPPEPIDATVALVRDTPALVMGTLRREITDVRELLAPSVVKVVVDEHGAALYFSRAPIPFTREGQPTPRRWKHLGLYVYRRQFLLRFAALPSTPLERAESLEQLRALEHGYRIGTVETTIDTVEIDTPDDLDRARSLAAAGQAP
ncbi:MAG: 3-deoxy-manno-octulosonate cytidylyltransferase [Acidobacteria bacterium]|nr:3-deoxy-manno-octulosonate cytidylyltransferase [Acidobacteriota bacterium]